MNLLFNLAEHVAEHSENSEDFAIVMKFFYNIFGQVPKDSVVMISELEKVYYLFDGSQKNMYSYHNFPKSRKERILDEILEFLNSENVTMKDFLNVPDSEIEQILRELDMEDLSLALNYVSSDIQEKFFRNMSDRAVSMIKEEMFLKKEASLYEKETGCEKVCETYSRLAAEGKCRPVSELRKEEKDELSN